MTRLSCAKSTLVSARFTPHSACPWQINDLPLPVFAVDLVADPAAIVHPQRQMNLFLAIHNERLGPDGIGVAPALLRPDAQAKPVSIAARAISRYAAAGSTFCFPPSFPATSWSVRKNSSPSNRAVALLAQVRRVAMHQAGVGIPVLTMPPPVGPFSPSIQ